MRRRRTDTVPTRAVNVHLTFLARRSTRTFARLTLSVTLTTPVALKRGPAKVIRRLRAPRLGRSFLVLESVRRPAPPPVAVRVTRARPLRFRRSLAGTPERSSRGLTDGGAVGAGDGDGDADGDGDGNAPAFVVAQTSPDSGPVRPPLVARTW